MKKFGSYTDAVKYAFDSATDDSEYLEMLYNIRFDYNVSGEQVEEYVQELHAAGIVAKYVELYNADQLAYDTLRVSGKVIREKGYAAVYNYVKSTIYTYEAVNYEEVAEKVLELLDMYFAYDYLNASVESYEIKIDSRDVEQAREDAENGLITGGMLDWVCAIYEDNAR